MKVGVIIPQTEVPPDPVLIKDYAQAIEALGFDHLVGYDHVVGADVAHRPDWGRTFTNQSSFYEPLVMFAFLAGVTKTLEFATGVLVLSQRQTALVAKQASILDVLCQGRLRLGIGTGWNPLEYEALGVAFEGRGKRLDEQIDLLRSLWTQESVSFEGQYHRIDEIGISPPPVQRPIPLWIGGRAPAAVKRAATRGDGWMPVLPVAEAQDQIGAFYEQVKAAGRDPSKVGVENIFSVSISTTADARSGKARGPQEDAADCLAWRKAGATHVSLHAPTIGMSFPDDHVKYFADLMNSLR